jgi:glycosyltransferase involved in cell wall biosynthesis
MKPEIFFLNSCVEWGGGEKWTLDTARELADRGYHVTIGTVSESELFKRARQNRIEVQVVPVRGSFSVLNPWKMKKFIGYLRKKNIEVLFLNLSQDLKFGAVAGKWAGVRKIIYRRGLDVAIADKFYTKYLLMSCVTDIIANSNNTKETLLQNTSHWLKEEKIRVIYNGIKSDQIELYLNKRTDIREEFHIDKGVILIANIGRLSEQKGHKYLLEAINLMQQKTKNFKVLIIGKGELEQDLKRQAEELELNNLVIFTGFRKDIYNILSQIDFLLHVALWEGCSNIILETMALAKPIVATDINSVRELVIDGKTGLLAECANSFDIAEKAMKMMGNNERNEMGEYAKQIVSKHFNYYDKISQLEKILLN